MQCCDACYSSDMYLWGVNLAFKSLRVCSHKQVLQQFCKNPQGKPQQQIWTKLCKFWCWFWGCYQCREQLIVLNKKKTLYSPPMPKLLWSSAGLWQWPSLTCDYKSSLRKTLPWERQGRCEYSVCLFFILHFKKSDFLLFGFFFQTFVHR